MPSKFEDLTVDPEHLDVEDICSAWQWRIREQKSLMLVSKMGDVFFLGKDEGIYWLRTDTGDLQKVAENLNQFEFLLGQEENLDNWFLPDLIEQLETAGKKLGPNQVYSYKRMPVIGGDYSVENIEPTDIGVHFSFSGQICEQIQNLPEGTKLNVRFK